MNPQLPSRSVSHVNVPVFEPQRHGRSPARRPQAGADVAARHAPDRSERPRTLGRFAQLAAGRIQDARDVAQLFARLPTVAKCRAGRRRHILGPPAAVALAARRLVGGASPRNGDSKDAAGRPTRAQAHLDGNPYTTWYS